MKSLRPIALLLITATLLTAPMSQAEDKPAATQKYDFAMVKWDGPDRIQYILPDKFEVVRLGKKFPKPEGAQDEEYYLTMAANELAKQGWEAIAIDSRRILLRRGR